ncbi:MAG TPA: hypothetical protein VFU49_08060 [Ktedonobacteraceae bacterium]|nr:hypothetical protein [Ktedonobacteraceae bacterium]
MKTKPLELSTPETLEAANNGDNSRNLQRLGDSLKVKKLYRFLPLIILFAMECAFLLANAALPLVGLWFHTALLPQMGKWVLLPTRIIFYHRELSPTVMGTYVGAPTPSTRGSWLEIGTLATIFLLILVIYLLALRYLPRLISRRYIIFSVLLLGITFAFVSIVTSQDIYSYIFYARMSILYHINPLTNSPMVVFEDPAYLHIYWVDQPSAYGPVWTIITGGLQWVTDLFGTGKSNLVPMVLGLRLLALAAHLFSTLLVWSICGHLQRLTNKISPQVRMRATLAFAWNPLLLFEACVNAHNDTVLLLFVLLAVWFLVRLPTFSIRSALGAAMMLGLATCLKINIVLLIPGLVLFLWTQPQRIRAIIAVLAVYAGSIVLLYAPFWDHGAILGVLRVNPGTYRNINTVAEFLTHFFNSVLLSLGYPKQPDIGSLAEIVLHTLSMAIFALTYIFLCGRVLLAQNALRTPVDLLRWMALIWFLYCALGTPWMWPWYLVTFFGLFALIESVDIGRWQQKPVFGILYLPLAARLFSFSMLFLYCFYAWAPHVTIPGLPGFEWPWLRGLFVWFIPLLAVLPRFVPQLEQRVQTVKALFQGSSDNTYGEAPEPVAHATKIGATRSGAS